MIGIIIGQLVVVLIWILGRYTMCKSPKYWFGMNEIHHYDIFLLSLICPVFKVLNNITGELQYDIALIVWFLGTGIIAIDDIYQHRKQAELQDPKFEGPLKRIFKPIWSLPWRLRK